MKSKEDILKVLDKYNLESDINKAFPKVWKRVSGNSALSSQEQPIGVLLGGQPGAGKSYATMKIKERLNSNVLIINGDEFRSYHKHYEDFYQLYGKDASKYTGAFAGKMVEKVRDEAIKNKFNVVIEGTFRTAETPLKELNNFKERGYQAEVIICTCPKELSWESTIKRAEELDSAGLQPRYVPKEHHDIVTENLARNAATIFSSGLVSQLEIYSREAKLFDSKIDNPANIEETINRELNGLNQGVTPIKAQYESKLATLPADQQQKARFYEQQAFNAMQYMPAEFHEKTQQAIYENQIDLIHDGKYHAPDVDLKSIEYTQESSAQTSDWEIER